jgi:hypothetical protein
MIVPAYIYRVPVVIGEIKLRLTLPGGPDVQNPHNSLLGADLEQNAKRPSK